MISKGLFCKVLQMIQNQKKTDEEFSSALEKVGDGHFVFNSGNKYFEALMLVLKEALPDKYDYVGWWLYEATPDYKVWSEDDNKEWNLREPEDLYDFITTECN